MRIDFESSHECEKSKGKMIVIEIDMLGNMKCSYCHEKVNYQEKK